MAVNGIIGTWAGPYEPGTAYVMAHHSIGDVGDGQLGSWGYPEGGMGGVSEAIARSARSFGAEIRTKARVARLLVRDGRVHGAVLENGDEISAPLVVTTLAPENRLPRPHSARRTARRLRRRHRALEDAQRRREDQSGAGRAPQLHRQPQQRPGRASHRIDRDGADDGVHRGGLPGRARGQARADAVQRRCHPHHAGQDAESRWHAHHVAVHPMGARGVERGAAHRGTRRVRRPRDRPVRPGRAGLQVLDHCTATSSDRTRWSRSTA